jgi:hypothetical protein
MKPAPRNDSKVTQFEGIICFRLINSAVPFYESTTFFMSLIVIPR